MDSLLVQLSRYEIVRHLGGGGMGDVYLARRRGRGGFERRLAIKVMRPDLAISERGIELFLREGAVLSGLRHRNIVQVFELDEDNGRMYLAMELLEGVSLRRLASAHGGRLPPRAVAWIAREIARGLHAAHTTVLPGAPSGVIHRDLSPTNVMTCSDGSVKILDFGLARPVGQMPSVSTVEGKLAFLPPESLAGVALDARADVYALGVSMYELLTGALPFDGPGPLVVMRAIETGDYVPIARHGVSIPTGLVEIVRRAMSRDLGTRYASARELEEALGAYVGDFDEVALERLVAAARDRADQISTEADLASPKRGVRPRWVLAAAGVLGVAGAVAFAAIPHDGAPSASAAPATATQIPAPPPPAPAPAVAPPAPTPVPAAAPEVPAEAAPAAPPTVAKEAADRSEDPAPRVRQRTNRKREAKKATSPIPPAPISQPATGASPGVLLDPFGKPKH